MPQTTHFTMVNPGIHELLQSSVDRLIQVGSGMAQTARRSKASKASAQQWWFAMQDFINATDKLMELRRKDSEDAV